MKHRKIPRLGNRLLLRWALLGLAVALLDALVVAALRGFLWVIESADAWVLLPWAIVVVTVAFFRMETYRFRLGFSQKIDGVFSKRSYLSALRRFLGTYNGGLCPAWDESTWQDAKTRERWWILSKGEWVAGLVHVGTLLLLLSFFQIYLALLALALAWMVMRPKVNAQSPRVGFSEVHPVVGRWWVLQTQAWPQILQAKALHGISQLYQRHLVEEHRSEQQIQAGVYRSEFRAQTITVMILALSAMALKWGYLDLQNLIGFSLTLVLLHPPLKKMMLIDGQRRQFLGHLWGVDRRNLRAKKLKPPRGEGLALDVQGLCLEYNSSKLILNSVNFTLEPTQALWLNGPSGSGKSSLLRILAGLQKPTAGQLSWPLGGVAYLCQNTPKPLLTHEELLVFIQMDRQKICQTLGIEGLFEQLLGSTSIATFLDLDLMSGGELQRFTLWLILLQPSTLVLLDEPFSKLPVAQRVELCCWLRSWCIEHRRILVMASHETPPDLDQWQVLKLDRKEQR